MPSMAKFDQLPEAVQNSLLAHAGLLEQFGPSLGRPRVDTLNGSRHANMKELRFELIKVSGVLLSPLTPNERQLSWWVEISRVVEISGFIGNSFKKQMNVLMNIFLVLSRQGNNDG